MKMSLALGTLLADTYRVIRLVGAGGMGEVYEATHDRLPGRYAVKVLLAEVSDRAGIFQRFRREAEVTSSLRHPNIVQVLDFNVTPEGHPYLVMEYLDGVELAAELARTGAMPVARALDIIGQIASALAAAHTHKIVHRDLKPQNLFLVKLPGEEREVVKVVDFGISKVREATTKLTQEAAIIGTPQYMAPEQARGRLNLIDERTDEFALATIAYELLTGRAAFSGDAVPAILYQVVHEQPESMRSISPNVGPALEAVVLKAMSKEPADRYPTVLAFHRALAAAAQADHNVRTAELPAPTTEPSKQKPHPPKTASLENTTTLGSAAAEVEPRADNRKLGRKFWIIGGTALVGLLVAGLSIRWTRPTALPALPAPPPAPVPVAQPVAEKKSVIEVENAPNGLQVQVDGVERSLPVELPFGAQTHRLGFRAPGYEDTELHVDGMREHRSIVLAMKPAPPRAVEAPAAKKQPGDPVEKKKSAEQPQDKAPAAEKRTRGPAPAVADRPTSRKSAEHAWAQAAPPSPSPQPPAPAAKPPEKKTKLITDF